MEGEREVYRYMTPSPHTIGRDASSSDARELMRRFGIHHLPVVDQGSVVGLVTDRDLEVVDRIAAARHARAPIVSDAMGPNPYLSAPSTPVTEVARAMVQKGADAAVIVEAAGVVGVFTAIDALRALAESVTPKREVRP
jgi:acetoin utilization protein AcuB